MVIEAKRPWTDEVLPLSPGRDAPDTEDDGRRLCRRPKSKIYPTSVVAKRSTDRLNRNQTASIVAYSVVERTRLQNALRTQGRVWSEEVGV